MDKQVLSNLFRELEPVLAQNGYELLDIRWLSEQGKPTLRVYIDHASAAEAPEGEASESRRIAVEDCSRVSRLIDPVLDVVDFVKGRYSLEVSSPGLDRPLRTQSSFERAVGELAKIKLAAPIDGQRNFKGRLLRVEAGKVCLQDETGREHLLPAADIEQANVIGRIEAKNKK